jgi:hypothetical protein
MYRYLLLILLLWSCSNEASSDRCFGFDQRSCDSNPWEKSLVERELTAAVTDYLSGVGIVLVSIETDLTYHEVSCQACEVCPDGPRFFIRIEEADIPGFLSLPLLNIQETDCAQ